MPKAARERQRFIHTGLYWFIVCGRDKFFFPCSLEEGYANYGVEEDISVPLVSIGSDSTLREMNLSVDKIQ